MNKKNVLVEGELFPLFFSTFFFDLLGLDFCFFPFNFDFLPSFDFCCNLVFFFNDFFFKLDFSFFKDLLLLSLLETLDSRFCLDDELILARLADEGSGKKMFCFKKKMYQHIDAFYVLAFVSEDEEDLDSEEELDEELDEEDGDRSLKFKFE